MLRFFFLMLSFTSVMFQFRSSCPEVFCNKDVLRNLKFCKIHRKTPVSESLAHVTLRL